jgi:hypothetical protein
LSRGRADTIARIFNINDIRDVVPEELGDETIYRIGYNLPRLLRARSGLPNRARPHKTLPERHRRALCGGKAHKN